MTTSQQVRNIQHSEYSRLWLLQGRANPNIAPSYESLWKAGAPSWSFGAATNIWVPRPDEYGQFDAAGKIIGDRGNPKLPIEAYYVADERSLLLRLAAAGCDQDLQVHMGVCKDPRDFNRGWTKILVLESARPTDWSATQVGALTPSERSTVKESVPFDGQNMYEIVEMIFQEKAAAQVVQEVVDIVICDRITCASCGIASDGCDKIFAVTKSNAGSPGLPGQVIYSSDGGQTWGSTVIDTLAANMNASAAACVGENLVVVSEDEESLHYANLAAILAGTETWTKVTTGFVATKGPSAIFSLGPTFTWIVGEDGYIYFSSDITAGVEVQDPGGVSVQDYVAVHGYDINNIVVVGDSNAMALTRDGGNTWAAITGPNVGVNLTSVWMRSLDVWMVGSADGKLWYTLNAGTTWTQKAFPGSGTGVVRDIKFSTPTVGYMSHDTTAPRGRVLRTIDGGFSWYVLPEGNTQVPANDQINKLAPCISDPNVVFGGGLADNGTDGFIVKGFGN